MPELKKGQEAETLSFEQAMSELEELVAKLDEGNLTLEDSLQLYEKGVNLSDLCHQKLEEAELRIKTIRDGKEKGNEF